MSKVFLARLVQRKPKTRLYAIRNFCARLNSAQKSVFLHKNCGFCTKNKVFRTILVQSQLNGYLLTTVIVYIKYTTQ